ncbi:uncharacterized protein DDB_G0284459 isoform X1 [Procambarus clarkii]|uniref:uncharacterized protein DDB_G0284459 isoform X1 n=2 Tax=Procambarus clarkii TaxID=6728 RepID=UPI003743CBDB
MVNCVDVFILAPERDFGALQCVVVVLSCQGWRRQDNGIRQVGQQEEREIPGASQHREAEKAGYLTKLSGRSFPYIPQWKRRYCVLAKGRLYYYEREDSKSGEKANGVINLEYFDHVAEAAPKDCKKATNVFVITSQDRSFFDPGRHLFSAESLPDMKDWVKKLQAALEQIRNNNRPAISTSTKESIKRRKEENLENKDKGQNKENQQGVAKEKKKKKTEESHRSRKSGVSSEMQTQTVESTSVASGQEAELQMMTSLKGGVQLPGLTSHKGIQLPGLSAKKELQDAKVTETSEANKEELPMSGPTLLCVTKQRVKGPQGRRAPQNHRRTLAANALKKRASSLSALEYQDLNDNSEEPWLNRSLDVLEDGGAGGNEAPSGTGSRPTLPYKAYNYSSDDDNIDDDGDISHSDSFPNSASGMLPPPPPPPRSASFGLELRQNPPLGSAELRSLHNSLGDARGSQGDLGGPKRSLSNGRIYGMVGEWQQASWGGSRSSLRHNGDVTGRASPVMDDLDNMLMNQSIQHTSGIMDSSDAGSEGSTCRAVDQPYQQHQHRRYQQHQRPQQQQQQQQQKQQQQHLERKKSHDLSRFATAVRHLQRHVVEVDRAVFNITSDIADTRQEVTALKEAVLALQVDTDTITTTLSNLTQEAITAQEKITFATQSRADFTQPAKEAERVQHAANLALRDAERARQEQQKSKREYEELATEVKMVLKALKDSQATAAAQALAITTQGQPQTRSSNKSTSTECRCVEIQDQGHKTTDDSATRSSHEHRVTKAAEGSTANQVPGTSSPTSARASVGSISSTSTGSARVSVASSTGSSGATVVPKSSASPQVTSTGKTTGYQSLFAKSSSIISGLTSRHSLTKSVSFADQKDKEKTNSEGADIKSASSDKNKKGDSREKQDDKHHSTLERKEKKDAKHQKDKKHSSTDTSSMERRSKDKKDNTGRKDTSSIDRKDRKGRHEQKDRKGSLQEAKASGNIISQISLDDIPMADENSQELLKEPEGPQAQVSTVCTKCSSAEISLKPALNFSLGKSSSSPTVSYGGTNNRPRALPLKREHHRVEQSISNASSPESPTAPSPFPRPSSGLSPLEESPPISESSSVSSLHRPGSTPGPLARQGSMTTVPENSEVAGPPPTKRPGVFAISRQNSTPNIPLQRQNSGPIFPLQRQHSLGVVPEEGRLPRQDSLMSVPEERPIVDQTLPLSPAPSMTQFPLSPTASSTTLCEAARRAARESMELVTGPVLAGSSMQEATATGTLPVLDLTDEDIEPSATSTLKKDQKPPTGVVGILV